MHEALKYAAELAEKEGRYRDAYGKWKQLVTECEYHGIPDTNLYTYYRNHMEYCKTFK